MADSKKNQTPLQRLTESLTNVVAELWTELTAKFATKEALARNEADHWHPVDVNSLTPSSTFVQNSVIGINGVLYRAKKQTSHFPVTLTVEDGKFVVEEEEGKIAFVVADETLSEDWEVFTDAAIEYWVKSLNKKVAGKQDAISDLTDIRQKATSALQPSTVYKVGNTEYTVDAMLQELAKLMPKTIVTKD